MTEDETEETEEGAVPKSKPRDRIHHRPNIDPDRVPARSNPEERAHLLTKHEPVMDRAATRPGAGAGKRAPPVPLRPKYDLDERVHINPKFEAETSSLLRPSNRERVQHKPKYETDTSTGTLPTGKDTYVYFNR